MQLVRAAQHRGITPPTHPLLSQERRLDKAGGKHRDMANRVKMVVYLLFVLTPAEIQPQPLS